MPDIYVHLDGQQLGPYQPAQLRQLLAEGKVTADTPAWHQALTEWSTAATVLAAFTPVPPPYVPPAPPPPFRPAKQEMSGCAWAAVIAAICFGGVFVVACLAGVALGPITAGIEKAKESSGMQQARSIGLAMFAYASDHNGAYPDGVTSTEVFQKLVDGKYADPGLFYITMPGKIKSTSNKLTADNVCFDVTSDIGPDSSGYVPVVFSTGYTVTYAAGAGVTRAPGASEPFRGIAVAYKDNSARSWTARTDGTVPHFIPDAFDPGTNTYRQLTP